MTKPVELIETLRIQFPDVRGFYYTTHRNLKANTQTCAWLTMRQILIAYPWFSDDLILKLMENTND